ncbi:Os01g0682700, partial [Oryza sativa Japonica Group]
VANQGCLDAKRHVDSTGWCRGEPPGFLAQYGLGPNLLLVWDPSRWHMATLCRLWKCLVVKASKSPDVAVLHGLGDPG